MTRIPGGGTGCRPIPALLTAAALAVFSYPAEAGGINTVLPVAETAPIIVAVTEAPLCETVDLAVYFLEKMGIEVLVEGCGGMVLAHPVPAAIRPVKNVVVGDKMKTIMEVRFLAPLPALPSQTMFSWIDAHGGAL